MSKRTTLQAIEEAKVALAKEQDDSDGYHSKFDELLEERLAELDPDFMTAMEELYKKSGTARWYA